MTTHRPSLAGRLYIGRRLPPPQALLIESSNRCGRKFRDAQAVLTLAGKARKRLLNNASISRQKCRFLVTTK